jgi:hypothetical protein
LNQLCVMGDARLSSYRSLFIFLGILLLFVWEASAVTFVINDGDASLSLAVTPDQEVAISIIAADNPDSFSATMSADDRSGATITQGCNIGGAGHIFSASVAGSPDGDTAGTLIEMVGGTLITSQEAGASQGNGASVGQETLLNVNNGKASIGTLVKNPDDGMATCLNISGLGEVKTIQSGNILSKKSSEYSFMEISQISNISLESGESYTNTPVPYEQSIAPFNIDSMWLQGYISGNVELDTYQSFNRTVNGNNYEEFGTLYADARIIDGTVEQDLNLIRTHPPLMPSVWSFTDTVPGSNLHFLSTGDFYLSQDYGSLSLTTEVVPL